MFSDQERFILTFREKLETMHGKAIEEATDLDKYETLGTMVREHASKNWISTNKQYKQKHVKQVYYFSMEFLLGKSMAANLMNLGVEKSFQNALQEIGIDILKLEEYEPDAGLGNGGLGRLAACFMDSLASLQMPGHGCGIRYKYGLFEQKIIDGYQVELPENWLQEGNVWEIRKSDRAVEVKFGGRVSVDNIGGRLVFRHTDYDAVLAVPFDMPMIGYHNKTVNTLRLWYAEALEAEERECYFNPEGRRTSNYWTSAEAISEFLYPNDSFREGKILRLKQQYFLVSASVQSLINKSKREYGSVQGFSDRIAIHINDTHPSLAIPELMRILLDREGMEWDEAWELTTNTISYTNHTTMTEALEVWSAEIFRPLLPRIYQIIEEINERFCRELWKKYPEQWDLINSMAIISFGQIRMAHLAIVGSHSVNGVSKLHTDILKNREMKNFARFYPGKFNNKTNGISHRRWLLHSNPTLADLISEAIGPRWIDEPLELKNLAKYAKDAALQEAICKVKLNNKTAMASNIRVNYGLTIDPGAIMDVQVKRLHMYKRQLLNILNIMHTYNLLLEDPGLDIVPRTYVFGAKSAPTYHLSKQVIKLINTVGALINDDNRVNDRMKIVFLANYRVSLAEKIIPAAEISQQISTATKEASGTGNMKFMMNGAITIGSRDGANIEIMEEVGPENIFTFGLTPGEVNNYCQGLHYCSLDEYKNDERLKTVLDQLINGFLPAGKSEFDMIYRFLIDNNDEFFVLRDFSSYVDAQTRLDEAYRDKNKWAEMSINNIAGSGRFSSDRTIKEYSTEIWKLKPYHIV